MYNRFAMFRVAWVARGRFSCHIYQNNILLFNVAGEASLATVPATWHN